MSDRRQKQKTNKQNPQHQKLLSGGFIGSSGFPKHHLVTLQTEVVPQVHSLRSISSLLPTYQTWTCPVPCYVS